MADSTEELIAWMRSYRRGLLDEGRSLEARAVYACINHARRRVTSMADSFPSIQGKAQSTGVQHGQEI